VLFMPGSNARAIEKARTLPADVLVLDLEDAVAPEMKLQARAQVGAAVRAGGYGHREIVVRVNALGTSWGGDDITAAAASGADAVLLPKVESAETVSAAIAALGPAPAVWCMLETPRGILNAAAIAAASPRVSALVMGTSDLTKDLQARVTRERLPLLTSLQLCVPGRAIGRDHRPGRRSPRSRRRRRLRGCLPPGRRLRLRRQDADPSQADRHRQRGVRAGRR
jgi:citrate lyase subunit beta/citryl-CoA lyase